MSEIGESLMKCNVLGDAENDGGGKKVFLKRTSSLCGSSGSHGHIFAPVRATRLLSKFMVKPSPIPLGTHIKGKFLVIFFFANLVWIKNCYWVSQKQYGGLV